MIYLCHNYVVFIIVYNVYYTYNLCIISMYMIINCTILPTEWEMESAAKTTSSAARPGAVYVLPLFYDYCY